MNFTRSWVGLAMVAALTACTSTERRAAEYRQPFFLAEDVHVYACHTFTGLHSLWFTGPQKVDTVCSATTPVAGARTLKKGCPVRVVRLFKTHAVDSSSSESQWEILDPAAGTTNTVYVKWPGAKALLTTEAPAAR